MVETTSFNQKKKKMGEEKKKRSGGDAGGGGGGGEEKCIHLPLWEAGKKETTWKRKYLGILILKWIFIVAPCIS